MEKHVLENLVNQNLSSHQIAKTLGYSQTNVSHWLKKYNLKTNWKRGEGWKIASQNPNWNQRNKNRDQQSPSEFLSKLNWQEIQTYYDAGKTWKDVSKKFSLSFHRMTQAVELGLFKSRSQEESHKLFPKKGRKHSEETKRKLSLIRKEYLSQNPDKCSWKTSDKHRSIPCEQLKEKLRALNIKFEEEYQPLLHKKRMFSIDISFPEQKIGIEINGYQHYDTNGNLKPYYQNRHDLIVAEGWTLYEVPYHRAFNIEYILSLLKTHKLVDPVGFEPTINAL